jgi:hypothetical protein
MTERNELNGADARTLPMARNLTGNDRHDVPGLDAYVTAMNKALAAKGVDLANPFFSSNGTMLLADRLGDVDLHEVGHDRGLCARIPDHLRETIIGSVLLHELTVNAGKGVNSSELPLGDSALYRDLMAREPLDDAAIELFKAQLDSGHNGT